MTVEELNNQIIYTITRKRLLKLMENKVITEEEYELAISEIIKNYNPLIPYYDLK